MSPFKFKIGDMLETKVEGIAHTFIKIKARDTEGGAYIVWSKSARFPMDKDFVEEHYDILKED
jgi:hypothetical protein